MKAYIIGLLGMWIVCDGIYSLLVHVKDEKQTWWRDHSFRIIRIAIGIIMMATYN